MAVFATDNFEIISYMNYFKRMYFRIFMTRKISCYLKYCKVNTDYCDSLWGRKASCLKLFI